jgi:DNA-binding MarR family transcriptional regulator
MDIEKQTLVPNHDLWLLMGKIHHKRMLLRQKELKEYNIPTRQLYMLQLIRDLGLKTTISEIAKTVEREVESISRQLVSMEKDGLIKRTRVSPKSRLLKIELTEKGIKLAKISGKSKAMDKIISVLNTEEQQILYSLLNRMLIAINEYASENNT